MNKTRKMIFLALLISIGMVLGIVESYLPMPMPIPGAKLGLSNVVQLIVIAVYGYREGLAVAVIKSLLVSIGTGNMSGLMYGLPAALMSTLVMVVTYRYLRDKFSLIGISILGALSHNLSQILVATAVLSNFKIIFYYPYMALISIVTGYFIGLTAYFFIRNTRGVVEFRKDE